MSQSPLRSTATLWRETALAIVLGAIGGGLAYWADVPLAFMLGSMGACMIASFLRAPVFISMRFRSVFLALVGLFLGESFDASTTERLAEWPLSVALAMLYVPVAAAAAYLMFRYLAGLDRFTALFSAVPGGLSAIIILSSEIGGDERKVALSQSLRVALVVLTAPGIAFGLLGYAAPAHGAGAEAEVIPWAEAALLVGTAGLGATLMISAGAPLPMLVAPLLASAGLRLLGLVDGALPLWLVEAALVVVGGSIGCRFRGAEPAAFLRLAFWTVLGSALMMAVSALFGGIASALLGIDLIAALLAFAPGGVAEMCLIAIAIDADPSFVATHHIARIVFILLAAPFFAAWLKRRAAA